MKKFKNSGIAKMLNKFGDWLATFNTANEALFKGGLIGVIFAGGIIFIVLLILGFCTLLAKLTTPGGAIAILLGCVVIILGIIFGVQCRNDYTKRMKFEEFAGEERKDETV